MSKLVPVESGDGELIYPGRSFASFRRYHVYDTLTGEREYKEIVRCPNNRWFDKHVDKQHEYNSTPEEYVRSSKPFEGKEKGKPKSIFWKFLRGEK